MKLRARPKPPPSAPIQEIVRCSALNARGRQCFFQSRPGKLLCSVHARDNDQQPKEK